MLSRGRHRHAPMVASRLRVAVRAGEAVAIMFTAMNRARPARITSSAPCLPIALIVAWSLDRSSPTSVRRCRAGVVSVMVFGRLSYRTCSRRLLALPAIYVISFRRTIAAGSLAFMVMGRFLGMASRAPFLIAVGTGRRVGRGLMNGVQKLFYLPEPFTDFIMSVIAEETVSRRALVVLCFCVIACEGENALRRRQFRRPSGDWHQRSGLRAFGNIALLGLIRQGIRAASQQWRLVDVEQLLGIGVLRHLADAQMENERGRVRV